MAFAVPGYRVDRPLGAGSSGEVWSAVEEATGQRVALKRIATSTEAARAAAEREAALLTGLLHPHLVRLRAFLPVAGAAVLVLELAEAGSLAGLLRRRSHLTPPEVVAAVSPVAAALAYVHEAGVLHGDISPANLLFTAGGYPKLADLGLARMLPGGDLGIGTPAYLDPVVAAGAPLSRASDVFSLAAVALHALTGSGPWCRPGNRRDAGGAMGADGPSAEQVLAIAATGRVVDLVDRLGRVPPGLAAALRRALDPVPDRRGTAGELALDLRASLPPRPVVLAGGRIVDRVGRHSADREFGSAPKPEPPFHDAGASGPNFVPADLTSLSARLAPLVDMTGVAAPPNAVPPESVALQLRGIRRRGSARPVPGTRLWSRPALLATLGVLLLATIGVIGRSHFAESAGRRSGTSTVAATVPVQHAQVQHAQAQHAQAQHAQAQHAQAQHAQAQDARAMAAAGRPATGGRPPVEQRRPALPGSAIATAERALSRLGAARERAFAQRRPELLHQVYRSSDLFRADSSVLLSTVPPGCGLLGLRPDYRQLRVAAQPGGQLRIEAAASLPSATLRCGGRLRGRTAAGPPVTLSLLLTRSGAEYRIASQTTS